MKRAGKAAALMLCIAAIILSGCTPQNAATAGHSQQQAGRYAEITDDTGKTVVLRERPKRVVVLSTSLLAMVGAVDGDIVGRATVKSEDASIPPKYESVPDVGPVYNVSTEKIIELSPDVVIVNARQHEKLIPLLEQQHIAVIALKSKTYDDVKRNIAVIGRVYGKEDEAAAKIMDMDKAIAAITDKLPRDTKRIAVIYASPSAVAIQRGGSIAGNVASILGFENIGDAVPDAARDAERVPYSMEALVAQNPEIIFFTTMGPKEKVEKRLRADVTANPVWHTLRAVQEGNIYVLPENYFLLNPGLSYPDAVAYMARLVYPEVYP